MKHLSKLLFLLCCLTASSVVAQSPQAISYQAVARTMEGNALSNASLIVKMGIVATTIDGNLMWEEEHAVVTDDFGLFTLSIGTGTSTGNGLSPSFELINWGATSYFLSVEIDEGTGFELLGISQLLSVPYALYAENADPTDELIQDFTFENDSLIITDAGEEHVLDIGPMLDEALNGESINLVQLIGTDLNIVEGDDAFVVDLSSLQEDGDWEVNEEAVYSDGLNVGIETPSPSSLLTVNGSVAFKVEQLQGPINADLTISSNIVLANVSNGDITLNLPDASICPGRLYKIKRFGNEPLSSSVTLLPLLGQSIEGEPEEVLSGFDGQVLEIISDGSNWWIMSKMTIE
ncbi:MAG: hypothetical protein P8H59_01275 [Flavobacteriales bacterium]|nr:hypothetical protein [Flavobacteriales bacterium]MDG1779554.1 hypothetical protein [Flavobacteriales bacterium]MDG2244729.1 hypothetical protein [Flavobacteriales bacterium]